MARSAGEALRNHVTLEPECFDRLYLNAYVPPLRTGAGAAWFFREVRGNPVPSSALMAPMTRRFTESLERFAPGPGVDAVTFGKGERRDDVTQGYLRGRRRRALHPQGAGEGACPAHAETHRSGDRQGVTGTCRRHGDGQCLLRIPGRRRLRPPASSSSARTSRTTPGPASTGTGTRSGGWRNARSRSELPATGSWAAPIPRPCGTSPGGSTRCSASGSQVKTWLKWSGFAFPGAVPLTLESGTRVPSHRGLRTGPVRDRPHRDSRKRQCRPLFPSDGRGVRGRHVWR